MKKKSDAKKKKGEAAEPIVETAPADAPKEAARPPRKKTQGLLIAGALLLIFGILFSLYAYNTSYQKSLLTDSEDAALRLSLQRPYSYGLTITFFAFLLTCKGILNATLGTVVRKFHVKRLAQAGLLTALCYIGFAVFKIDIPVTRNAFHFGNVFCVLAALMLGGYWGGLAGALGMTIGDLTTTYVTSAPKTFLLKFCIGLVVGFVAHNLFRLEKSHSTRYVTGVTIFSSACGMLFNAVADPVVGYFYKTYLLGVPQDLAQQLAKIGAVTTAVNAVIAVILSSVFYLALRPALKKAGLLMAEEEAQDAGRKKQDAQKEG